MYKGILTNPVLQRKNKCIQYNVYMFVSWEAGKITSFMSNYLISCSVVIYVVCVKRFITEIVCDVVMGDKS